jgi:hypothetical protein
MELTLTMCPWFVFTMCGSHSLINRKTEIRFVRTVSSTSWQVPSMKVKLREPGIVNQDDEVADLGPDPEAE